MLYNSTWLPYTYLIGWKQYNTWYYGCKFGKDAHPKNFWKTYFTSSKEVAKFRKEYGEPDVIQIRHTFDNKEACRYWEQEVLHTICVRYGFSKWLNKGTGLVHDIEFTPIVRKKLSVARTEYLSNPENLANVLSKFNSKGMKHTEEWKQNHIKRMTGRKFKVKVISCPHCGMSGGATNMYRYHFDNCKSKKFNDHYSETYKLNFSEY
jgi:hypothetical protein